jgi:hypothetical protein
LTQNRAEGFGEFDMDGGVVEEGGGASGSFIDDLIGDDQIARAEVLAQAADGATGQDVRAAELFEGVDVGAAGDL